MNVVTVHWVTTSGSSNSGNNKTKTNNDEHITAEMTFDGDKQEKPITFHGQMVQPEIYDDDSIISAELSQTSKKPITTYYN